MSSATIGVLIMAYGSAPSMKDEDIFNYLHHILQHYRRTDPSEVEFNNLKKRYQQTGKSPLYRITNSIVINLQQVLQQNTSLQFKTYMAMKHSPPFIEEMVEKMAEDGLEQAVAVAIAPFRSRLSTESYYHTVKETNKNLEQPLEWSFVEDWNLHPLFLKLWKKLLQNSLKKNENTSVIFTNHSLPAHIKKWNDPYGEQFKATAASLAKQCHLSSWTTAYQSQGGGKQSWLGPSLEKTLNELKDNGHRNFVVAPIGFLMDHLEILYDLDVVAASQAHRLGLKISRTSMPNDDPIFISMLADVIEAQHQQKT